MQVIIYAFGRELFFRADKRRPSPTVIIAQNDTISTDEVRDMIMSYWNPKSGD